MSKQRPMDKGYLIMFVVIFEVEPADGQSDTYFDRAAALKEELGKIDGFISVERFESVTNTGKYLSLSTWRDEKAIETWYRQFDHAGAQRDGRGGIFRDYRIRVANVIRDYDMSAGRPDI
jgi:heme-degrading monooxygenase HmoA